MKHLLHKSIDWQNSLHMLISHLGEYACEWAYECNWAQISNDRKTFVGVSKHSWGLAKNRNKLLKSVRKAYLQHIRLQL